MERYDFKVTGEKMDGVYFRGPFVTPVKSPDGGWVEYAEVARLEERVKFLERIEQALTLLHITEKRGEKS
jgi:hypothetical protein